MGAIFRFLGLCVCLGVQRGLSRVLIKYAGNVWLQIYNLFTKCEILVTKSIILNQLMHMYNFKITKSFHYIIPYLNNILKMSKKWILPKQ